MNLLSSGSSGREERVANFRVACNDRGIQGRTAICSLKPSQPATEQARKVLHDGEMASAGRAMQAAGSCISSHQDERLTTRLHQQLDDLDMPRMGC